MRHIPRPSPGEVHSLPLHHIHPSIPWLQLLISLILAWVSSPSHLAHHPIRRDPLKNNFELKEYVCSFLVYGQQSKILSTVCKTLPHSATAHLSSLIICLSSLPSSTTLAVIKGTASFSFSSYTCFCISGLWCTLFPMLRMLSPSFFAGNAWPTVKARIIAKQVRHLWLNFKLLTLRVM